MIRFLLGDEDVRIERSRADVTVLQYLREQRGMTGTKEGCASGDCGACTVVVASEKDGRLSYRPLNACIATLGGLHGKQLITVEMLREDTALHPVQAAMVEHHGSQCGFCTPGFVMSLFALYHRAAGTNPARETVLEALGGNLCRCTGYRPIVDAANAALAAPADDRFARAEDGTAARLRAMRDSGGDQCLADDSGTYLRPTSAAGVVAALAENPDARIVAGGTDLLLEVTQGLRELPVIIDVTAADDLDALETTTAHISIGAAVSHTAAQAAVLDDYPELAELIERFGSLQIRSQGTVVGNVANASPIGDWPPVLLALGASLSLQGPDGVRELPIDDFFLGYRDTALAAGEFIRSVEIPRRDPALQLRAYKISKRFEDDISSLCGVFACRLTDDALSDVRVAFGGMAATPARATGCEGALEGQPLNDATIAAASAQLAADFQPISDARAGADYRAAVAANLLRRLQLELGGEARTRAHAHASAAARGTAHG